MSPPGIVRYAVIGCGRIGARLLQRLPGAVAVLARRPAPAGLDPALVCTDLADLVARRPEIVVECASASALTELGPGLLEAGLDLVPLSLTALADRTVERRLLAAAERGPGRLELAPGAIGTLDLLAAAREDGLRRVVYRQLKAPAMWRLTPAAGLADLAALDRRTVFFRSSVRDVAARLPNNLNTAVGVALAGLGLDTTEAELVADPALAQTAHELEVHAAPGAALLRLGGRDVAPDGDPVDYTTFSLVRLLRRRTARVRI